MKNHLAPSKSFPYLGEMPPADRYVPRAREIFLPAGTTSWDVPLTLVGQVTVECIGPGGNGFASIGGGGGGGGGGYSSGAVSVTPGSTVVTRVDSGGGSRTAFNIT